MTINAMRFTAAERWLQAILTWTPGQTDMIKTVALVLMVIDHTGLLLVWGMNLARNGNIRQSQLNSLWCWAILAQGPFMLIGYNWYAGNILFAFAITGQALRWFSLPGLQYVFQGIGLLALWVPLSSASYGMAGVAMLAISWLLCRAQNIRERLVYGVLWVIAVLLMNMNDISQSLAGLSIALLTLIVCSSTGDGVKRFWPRNFFVLFYAVHLAILGTVTSI